MSDISPYGLAYVAVAQHRHFTEAVDASEYAVDIVLVQEYEIEFVGIFVVNPERSEERRVGKEC